MLPSDVLQLIAQGEGPKLEFKRDDVRPEVLAKEIVAFANMNGGRVLIGVEDDGSISGTQKDKLQEWLMDTVVGRHITPYIHLGYEEVAIDGQSVAVADVPMGTAKPYVLRYKDREDVYVRYGSVCRLADRTQQARLFESGGFFSAEKLPVSGAAPAELSKHRYQQYFSEVLAEKGEVDESFLQNRDFLVAANNELFCSFFAYACFAQRPGLRLPQAPVRVTVYPGKDKDYNTSIDEMLDVPYVELRSQDPLGEMVEPAIHQRVMKMIQPHISKELLVDSIRKRQWGYPEDAIREVVVNALIHRDWTKPGYVRVEAYEDRLEISSPGSLPNGMTVERIKSGARLARNQQLVSVFRDYGYLEDRGMGIRRKIIPLCLQHNDREPDFEATEDSFTVTLYKKSC